MSHSLVGLTQQEVVCVSSFIRVCVYAHECSPQLNEDGDCCQPPQPGSHGNRWMRYLTGVTLGATFLLLLYKAATGKINLHVCKSVY